MVNFDGQVVVTTKAIITSTTNMVLVRCTGLMAAFTEVNGKAVYKMV